MGKILLQTDLTTQAIANIIVRYDNTNINHITSIETERAQSMKLLWGTSDESEQVQ
jgi:hypothetical protein